MATELKPKSSQLYDADFYVWAQEQADLLRARRFETLDLANLIEEVEGLGGHQALRGAQQRARGHGASVEAAAQPGAGSARRSGTTRSSRTGATSPTSSRRASAARSSPEFARLYDRARADAATSLRLHGEARAADTLPSACPYSLDQITGDWWP